MLDLRIANLADVARIVELVNSAYRGESSRKGWTTEAHLLEGQRTDQAAISELISKPLNQIYLGFKEGRLVASVHLQERPNGVCFFAMFAVDPSLQTARIGRQMVQASEEFARKVLGCKTMEMCVISLRTELINWYQRRGYIMTQEERPFPYGNERFGIPLRDDLKLCVLQKTL